MASLKVLLVAGARPNFMKVTPVLTALRKAGHRGVEAYARGKAFVLDNFTRLTGYGHRLPSSRAEREDKGFRGHLANFFAAVRGEADLVTTARDGVRVADVIDRLRHGRGATAPSVGGRP